MSELSAASYQNLAQMVPVGGQSDGLYREISTGDLLAVVQGNIVARWPADRNCVVFEDFQGATTISTTVRDPWRIKDTSAAGTPTFAAKADSGCGAFQMKFAATNEEEILTLYWGDEQTVTYNQAPIFTCRLKVEATPASTDILVFGLASAQNDTEDSVATNAWFRISGANLNINLESDDGTTDNDDKDPSLTLTADTYYEFKIDSTDTTNVKFYYRSTLGGTWTALTVAGVTFTLTANTTNLQPFFQLHKSSGTGQTAIDIDYVKVEWHRS